MPDIYVRVKCIPMSLQEQIYTHAHEHIRTMQAVAIADIIICALSARGVCSRIILVSVATTNVGQAADWRLSCQRGWR